MKNLPDSQVVQKFRITSQIFAILVLLIGAAAVIGWQFNILVLKRILPSLPVIAPNTAVAFVVVGFLILLLSASFRSKSASRCLISILAAGICLLGMATLAEYFSGTGLGIDGIFFAKKMGADLVRMSPQSAFNFFSVGLALFFFAFPFKKSLEIGQWIILISWVISLTSLFGFIYKITNLYTISPYKGMAAHTAVAFTLVFIALLLFHTDVGFMRIFVRRNISSIAARRLFLALIAVVVLEIIVMEGRSFGLYPETYESLMHLLIVAGIFIFLIFFSFRSLDRLSEAEKSMAHLREIDKTKTEFVSLASHQLRTPLTSVSWFTEMLMKNDVGEMNPKQKEYLMEIYEGNRRMIDLVDDLLNASRIDMGVLIIEPKPVDLRKIADSALAELDPLIKEKNISVVKNFADDLGPAELDPELMRIVFQNLLSNAVKYNRKKGKVSISLGKSGAWLNATVEDNGYGIQKNQQQRIFTKLFRADNIRDKVTGGTGLGLYIVRAIVRQSGGKITFKSEENKGTSFFVSLPAKSRTPGKKTKKIINNYIK